MNNMDYSGDSNHEIELRKRYDDIFKVIGEKAGFSDFSYQAYLNDRLPTHQKEVFEDLLKKEIENPQDTNVKNDLSFINNSILVGTNHDQITDMKSFEAFGKKTVKTEPEEDMNDDIEKDEESNGKDDTEDHELDDEDEIEDSESNENRRGNSKKVFPGYDKRLPFFMAIKKAYQERRNKTNSTLLGALSGLRAAMCRIGPIVAVIVAVLGIAVPGFQFFQTGSMALLYRSLKYLGFIAGGSAIGAIWQKIEDGSIDHGIVGKLKNLFKGKKNKDEETDGNQRRYQDPTRTNQDELDPTNENERTAGQSFPLPTDNLKEDESREAKPEPAPKEETEPKGKSILELQKEIEKEEAEYETLKNAKANGYKFTSEDEIKFRNVKLNIKELRDKIRRSRPLEMDIKSLNNILKEEESRLEFWENEDRQGAVLETEEYISEIKNKISSCSNTENLSKLAISRLKYLSNNLKTNSKRYPDSNMQEEIKSLQEIVQRTYNTKMIQENKKKLLTNLNSKLTSSTGSDKEELEEEIATLQGMEPTSINPTIRLSELEIGKKLALSQGKNDLAESFSNEIQKIKDSYNEDEATNQMNDYVPNRITELERGISLARKMNRPDLIGSYKQEMQLIRSKYVNSSYQDFINAANWGVDFKNSSENSEGKNK